MKKKSNYPVSRICHPEPVKESEEWLIWAAWADRVTFEEIYEITKLTESEVIQKMRILLKSKTFNRWRKRVRHNSLKHRKLFQHKRRADVLNPSYKSNYES